MPKFCPHILGDCLEAKCAHWLAFPMRENTEPLNAPGILQYDCTFNWGPRFQAQTTMGILGTQAAIEDMRNETVARQDRALALAAQNGKLIGASSKD